MAILAGDGGGGGYGDSGDVNKDGGRVGKTLTTMETVCSVY
ncbi:hypothetical protein C5167_040896 [Papaver somniferum]|uniref:Uncharacterized protein n=1 Tax=Papaver somniferum TaxID=3469 RepID=A0A4Y7IGC1_PAPSO|nr:hypothetical protein C5167_040896 [Papaver somniferum]